MSRKSTTLTSFIGLLAVVTAISLAIAGCGSSGPSAQTKACNAVADIQVQVKQLQGYTLTTVTSDKVSGNLDQIQQDLTDIKDALPDLSSQLKSELQTATQEFTSQLQSVQSTLGKSTSIGGAATQITSAGDKLAADYQKAFASVSC